MTLMLIVVFALLADVGAFRRICYYTNWAQYRPGKGKFLPEYIDHRLCTHIIYAFVKIEGLHLKPSELNDQSTSRMRGMYARVLRLKRYDRNLKVLLAVGGYNMDSEPFISLVETSYARAAFSSYLVSYLRKWVFDGVDIHWKYPAARGSTPGDKPKFQLLLEEIMMFFEKEAAYTKKPRLLLTAVVPAVKTKIDNGYLIANFSSIVDFMSIMSYDLHGAWQNHVGFNSPLYAHPNETGNAKQRNVDWAARYYVSLGVPKDKLNIGIATYGRSFTLQDPSRHSILSPATGKGNPGPYSRESGVLAYYEICDMAPGGQIVQVPSQKNTYLVKNNQWVGYDDVDSVIAKTCYVIKNEFGGFFFWAMDFDDFLGTSCNQSTYPLMSAAYNVVRNPSTALCDKALAIPSTTMPPPKREPVETIAEPDVFRFVCYYNSWAQHRPGRGQFLPEHIDPDLCTHIMYAFAKPVGLDLQPFQDNDDNASSSEGMYSRVMKVKNKNPSINILLSAGGYNAGSEPFIPLVQTNESRKTFANNVVTFLRNRGFDGFDMFWQYPGARGSSITDKPKFQLLMEELMQTFTVEARKSGKRRLLLTVAVPAGKRNIDNGYEADKLATVTDFMSIMSFDLHGSWDNYLGFNSPLYEHPMENEQQRKMNVMWVTEYYLSLGVPRKKLNIGIATYGRSFTLARSTDYTILSPAAGPGKPYEYTRQSGLMAYYEVCSFILKDGTHVENVPEQGCRYAYNETHWVGYDDVTSVKDKACYALREHIGGLMFWTLDFDDFTGSFCSNGTYPLIKAAVGEVASAECSLDLRRSMSRGCSLVTNKGYLPLFVLLFILINACK